MTLSEWFIAKNGKIYKYIKPRSRKRRGVAVLAGAKNYMLKWKYQYAKY